MALSEESLTLSLWTVINFGAIPLRLASVDKFGIQKIIKENQDGIVEC